MKLELPKTKIYPGEPLPSSIRIYSLHQTEAILTDSLGIFDILQKQAPSHKPSDTGWNTSQTILITGYEPGTWVLPAIHAKDEKVKPSLPDTVVIMAIPADSLKHYTDIRSYYPAKTLPDNAVAWGLATLVLLSGGGLYFLLRSRRQGKIPKESSIVSAEEWQLQSKRLLQQWEAGKLSPLEAAQFQMTLVRALFALKGIPPASFTGAELVQMAQPSWPAAEWQLLQQVVSQAYSILFARQQPPAADMLSSIQKLGQAGTTMLVQQPRHSRNV